MSLVNFIACFDRDLSESGHAVVLTLSDFTSTDLAEGEEASETARYFLPSTHILKGRLAGDKVSECDTFSFCQQVSQHNHLIMLLLVDGL